MKQIFKLSAKFDWTRKLFFVCVRFTFEMFGWFLLSTDYQEQKQTFTF